MRVESRLLNDVSCVPKPTTNHRRSKVKSINYFANQFRNKYARQHPNQTFIDLTKNLLSQRFDTIDYYMDNVTVENYKQIPSQGYKLIIWRAHSALNNASKYVATSTSDIANLTYYDQ